MMRRDCRRKADNDRFMLGLAISALSLQPGERRTCDQIAAYCETTSQNISLIEQRALRKIRQALYCQGIRRGAF